MNLNSAQLCSAFKAPALSRAARNAKAVMSYGFGSATSAGLAASVEEGMVYGPKGEFGCYITSCVGGVSDVSISSFGAFGLFTNWSDFAGPSIVTIQGASIPFVEVAGFSTAQVLNTQPRLIGSVNSISVGAGLLPIQAGVLGCYTHVIDGNKGLNQLGRVLADAKSKATSTHAGRSTTTTPAPAVGGRVGTSASRMTTRWRGNGQCLGVSGSNPRLGACTAQGGRHWQIKRSAGGYYKLMAGGKCLDVINSGAKNQLGLAKCGAYTGQSWKLQRARSGHYQLTTQWRGPKLCLDVINSGAKNQVQLATCGNASGQQWLIDPPPN